MADAAPEPVAPPRARRRGRNVQPTLTSWSGGLHDSFRLLPTEGFDNRKLTAFLLAPDGSPWEDIYNRLPYDEARNQTRPNGPPDAAAGDEDEQEEEGAAAGVPDTKRYRDPRLLFESSGLLWEAADGRVYQTEFGRTVARFLPHATERNVRLLAAHAALALSVCQLRNPTLAGRRYAPVMNVFPFRFIWKAMLALDGRINSDELNRAIFSTQNEEMLTEGIERIISYRRSGNIDDLGQETLTNPTQKNNRMIPVVCLASFGWTILTYKNAAGFYTIRHGYQRLLQAAVSSHARHKEYQSVEQYVTAISDASCVPKDIR